MVPTLNGTGFMFQNLDAYANDFIRVAGSISDPVLDLGCAYGVATIPALEAGATVVASDMEQQHLDILQEKVAGPLRSKLTCKAGQLPGIDFEPEQFGAILCSRVIHFLTGEQIDASIAKIHRWLKPGGRFFLVADTPYGIWRKAIAQFEEGKKAGVRWPGLIVGLHNYIAGSDPQKPIEKPPFMNLMDVELLKRVCLEAGFRIERATFIDRSDFRGLGRMDGRENVGAVAIK